VPSKIEPITDKKSKLITWFEVLLPVIIHTVIVCVLTPSVLVGRYSFFLEEIIDYLLSTIVIRLFFRKVGND
jgi:hypothetical protein